MHQCRAQCCLLAALALLLWARPAPAQNVRIADYDVPVSRAHRLDFSGRLRLNGYNERTSSYYNAASNWESYYNSLPYAWRWVIDGRLYISDDNSRDQAGRKRKARYREIITAEGELRKYVKEDGLFYGGAATNVSWDYRYEHVASWAGVSVGLGRFVEATALAKALRIEQFLIKENILGEHLPREIILSLAAVIDQVKQYQKRYGETYPVWWYADMDQAIVASGLVSGNTIGAVGLLRVREVLERETVRHRAHGWTTEAGIGFDISRPTKSGSVRTWPYLAAAYALPIGLGSQVDIRGRANGQVGEYFGENFSLRGELSISHEVSNRIDLLFSETFQYDKNEIELSGRDRYANRQNMLELAFLFYLENAVTLNVHGRLEHENTASRRLRGGFYPTWYRTARRDWSVGASVNYRVF